MHPFEQGIPVERPPHRPAPSSAVSHDVITQWPTGTFVENLVLLDESSVLTTIVSTRSIERVSLVDGSRSTFARFDKEPTGITKVGDQLLINVGTPGEPGWSIWTSGVKGSPQKLVDIPEARFLNGNAALSSTSLLVVDSILGEVFEVDLAGTSVSSWLRDERLTKNSPEPMMPGVNGVQVSGGYAFFTSTERALVLRCPIHGVPRALEVIAEDFVGDDFAIDDTGTLYVTTHVHNQVLRLSPDGERTEIAGRSQAMQGSTSCVFDAAGDLLVTTTGGILAPQDGRVRPAKLVRLHLSLK